MVVSLITLVWLAALGYTLRQFHVQAKLDELKQQVLYAMIACGIAPLLYIILGKFL